MTTETLPGHYLLYLAVAGAAIAMLGGWRWWRGRTGGRRAAVAGTYAAAAVLVAAFVVLLVAFLADDFRYASVAGYSSRDLPLLYKISAVWAGQEGSFLLWVMFGALLAPFLLRGGTGGQPLALAVFQGTQVGALAILIARTPFEALAQVPPDGRGLNPLLQDPWMATHPPVVFLGYAAAAIPFALAVAALWDRDLDGWLQSAIRWTLVTVLTLGTGILLGAFWAYEVLGWGGYWGWDPVENSSLIPWLVAAALLHGLLVQRQTGSLPRSNLLMAMAAYILVIYATFLTRSGVLSAVSVHSFPEGGIVAPLVTLLLALTAVGGISLAARGRGAAATPLSWRLDLGTVLTVALALVLVSAAIILLGTSWPLLTTWTGEPAAPKPAFYNRANLPVWVLVAALLVAAPLLAWRPIPLRRLARVSVVPVLTGLGAAIWCVTAGLQAPWFVALALFAGAAVGSCLVRTARVIRSHPLQVGAPVAHVGLALLFLGILVSSAGERREEARLDLGQDVAAVGQTLRFVGPDLTAPGGQRFRIAVNPGKAEETEGRVELVRTFDGQVQRKPAILRHLRGDLYLSPVGIERGHRLSRRAVLARGVPAMVEGQPLRFDGFAVHNHEQGMEVGAILRLPGGEAVEATMRMTDEAQESRPVFLPVSGAQVRLVGMNVEAQQVELEVTPPGAPTMLLVEASWKPGMNVLWGGSLLLCLGTVIAVVRRLRPAEAEAMAEAVHPAAPPPPAGRRARARLRAAASRR